MGRRFCFGRYIPTVRFAFAGDRGWFVSRCVLFTERRVGQPCLCVHSRRLIGKAPLDVARVYLHLVALSVKLIVAAVMLDVGSNIVLFASVISSASVAELTVSSCT